MSRYLLLCILILAGCGSNAEIGRYAGVKPSSAAEWTVAKHIVMNANDPASVEFVKWGPHAGSVTGGTIFRVLYRAKNNMGAMQINDIRVAMTPDMKPDPANGVNGICPNDGGDNWIPH